MEKLIIGTLNVNQLGVPTGEEIPNANNVALKNLDFVLHYIETFFRNDSDRKILFLHEMKYRHGKYYTGGYKKFRETLEDSGYRILKHDLPVTFITLAITKNKDVIINPNSLFSHKANARYLELKYRDYIFLGIHQSLHKKYTPLPLVIFKNKCKDNFIILGDFNVARARLDKKDYTLHEMEFFKLVSDGRIIDVFGDSVIPTFVGGTRIDYILVSSNLMPDIMSFNQDNSPRSGREAFTDHSLLQIEINIDYKRKH